MGNPVTHPRLRALGATGLGLGLMGARAAGRAARAVGGALRDAAADPLIRRRVIIVGGNGALLVLPRLLPGGVVLTPVTKVVVLLAGAAVAKAAHRAGLPAARSVDDLHGVALDWLARRRD